MEPQHVDRRPGAANMEGELYEVGIATLLFLRGYFQTSDFSLNVNVDGAGAFDDVIFHYRQQSGARCKAYMQLKHKQNPEKHTINTHALCAKTGDFSLIHYFDSFCEIWERYGITDDDQFVIFTNAGLGNINAVQILDADILLDTGGKIISLAETEEQKTALTILEAYKSFLNDIRIHDQYTQKDIKEKLTPFAEMSHCKRLLKTLEGKKVSSKDRMANFHYLLQKQLDEQTAQIWQSFIDKLKLFVRQVSVNDLDNLIKETLRNYLGTDKSFLHLKYEMTAWWSKGKFNLSNNYAPFWNSDVNNSISDLVAPVINRLSSISELVFTKKLELSAKVVQIVTEGCTELSCLQVQQSLKDVGNFMVDFNTLASRTDEVLSKWRFLDWCRVLVVEGSLDHSVMSTDEISNIMSKVCDTLQSTEKRIVSISNNYENSFIANLSKKFKIQVHHENFNLNLLDEKSIVRILDCEVDFQGIPVKFGTLADNPKTRKAVKANFLLELFSKEGPIKIGECLPKSGPNYVARTLYRKEYVRNNIFQNNVFPKLAVSGLSKEQLRRLIGVGDKIEQFNENMNSVDNSSRYFIIKDAQDFNYLCNKLNADIHWIHWSEERFSWRLSTGPLKQIVEHLEDVKVKYDKIESFMNQPHKVVLILGEPGMGKSEELKSLASQLKLLDESTWVVRVVLNDCTEDLSKDQIDVRELLLKAANIRSEVGKMLFDCQLEIGGNIIVLFDGLDEINPTYTKKVNSMVEYLTKKVKKIWLTSRPIMWSVLEKQFRVLPFLLSPLTKNEQMNLLSKLWTYTKSCGEDQTEFEKHATMFAEKLLQITDTTLRDSLIFLSIPLHLMLLAEVFNNEVVESCKNGELDLPRKLDLLNLYSEFVDIKWNLYYDKKKLNRTVAGFDKLCKPVKLLTEDEVKNSAMVTLFDEDINQLSNGEEILRKNFNFIANLDSGEEMIGLVTHVQNGKSVFVHRTFAEYFAAIWFSENYLSNFDYFRKFYLSGSFETVRMFFDRILAREKILHRCVLSCNIDNVKNLLADKNVDIDELDRSGRTALHLAVANFLNLLFNRKNCSKNNVVYHNFIDNTLSIPVRQGSNKNVTYLLQIVEVLLKNGADCRKKDNILSWIPVQFAENNQIWCLLDLLLEYYSMEPGDLSVIKNNIQDKKFVRNVLETAAVDECVNVIQLIFDYRAFQSNFYFSHKRTLLHIAAFLGHLKLTQFLIDHGSDLEARDTFGLTPLMASSLNHNHKVTKMLLQHGADPNAMCRRARSAIHYAFATDRQRNFRFRPDIEDEYKTQDHGLESSASDGILILLEHGANPYDGYGYEYPIRRDDKWIHLKDVIGGILAKPHNIPDANTHLIAKWCEESNSKYGLKHPASDLVSSNNYQQILDRNIAATTIKLTELAQHPNTKDERGNSVIHFAVNFNLVSTVDLILSLECDFDGFNREGETPLLTAVKLGNEEIAMKLLKRGANPNAKCKYGNTPMYYAVVQNLMKMVECLLELKCDIEISDISGETPLLKAILCGNEEIAIMLLKHGANPNAKDRHGSTPMEFAIYSYLFKVVEYLLEVECDIDCVNKRGETPLLIAIRRGNEEIAIKLLKLGANANANDKYGNTPLHYATKNHLIKVVECLLELKCDIDCTNTEGKTPLLKAIKQGNKEIAIKLLKHGANPNTNNEYGNTPMHYAVEKNLIKVVECLLELDCDIDCTNTGGVTPLLIAIKEGNEKIVTKLLNHGANPKAKDKYGNTPMHYAAENHLMKVVEFLLELKCDIDCTNKYGETPLLRAVIKGNEEIAIKLLKHGANPNTKDRYGNTPMHIAVIKNLMKVAEFLLELDCDIDCTNTNSETPLLKAIAMGYEEIAIKLLKHGANPNTKNGYGNTSMHYAVVLNLMKVVECLLELECDTDCTNTGGVTPLLIAIKQGNEEIATKLLNHGSNPKATDKFSNTPMHYAAVKNLMNVVGCLLELECDVDCTNKEGETPLLRAIKWGNQEIAITLLKLGANPNAKDKYGNTTLHYATKKHLIKVVECLLELECDIDCTNTNSETPLLKAIRRGKEEIAIKLLKHGANPNAKDKYGNTTLHYAAVKNLMNVVGCLLELECDIDCTNTNRETPLLKAIKSKAIKMGYEEIAIKLLKHGSNPNANDEYDNTPMHYATEKNFMKVVECLLELECDVDCTNTRGETPLLIAIRRGKEEIAIKLLKHGANPKANDEYGNTPMHYAAEKNFMYVVECLLELECDIDCTNKYGETPLLRAIEQGNEEIATKLLKHGSNPKAKDEYGNTPMHYAAVKNLMNVVECLLELECDIDCTNKYGETPLLRAIKRGNEELAMKLLKLGANQNSEDKYDNTVLHFAAEGNLANTIDLLLNLECNFDSFNKEGVTPLLIAVMRRNEEIAMKLLKHGANPNATVKSGTV